MENGQYFSETSYFFQEYLRAGVKVPEVKIVGAANYQSMRANCWIAKFMKKNSFNVTCPLIGGVSPETVVAVISGSNPGRKLTDPVNIQDEQSFF